MKKPTHEQLQVLRVRIAELCGWTTRRAPSDWMNGVILTWYVKDGVSYATPFPDYCSDLNAMHEAEAKIHDIQCGAEWNAFTRHLAKITNANGISIHHAEAWQRAVALDRTLSDKPIL